MHRVASPCLPQWVPDKNLRAAHKGGAAPLCFVTPTEVTETAVERAMLSHHGATVQGAVLVLVGC